MQEDHMHNFKLIPEDVLFMRDARPMASSDAGLGANWPRPDQLYAALHHGFLSRWPEVQEWESANQELHHFRDKSRPEYKGQSKDKNEDSSLRFGALKTFGPFPCRNNHLYFPCPLDLGMEVIPCQGTDLPSPLTHGFLPKSKGKISNPVWISQEDFQRYLDGREISAQEAEPLYSVERQFGIAIDPERGSVREGKLYQAEYLRLRQGVSLAFQASCLVTQRGGEKKLTDVFLKDDGIESILMGGQQGVARLQRVETQFILPKGKITTPVLRWTLLAPAFYRSGWLPSWLDQEGKVMLKDVQRSPGERREEWKRRQNKALPVGGKLIAARIGKPVVASGWDTKNGGPKPTMLLVPAGSSYVFQCDNLDQARRLASLLNAPNPRSDAYGEKGFGLGICSSIHLPES